MRHFLNRVLTTTLPNRCAVCHTYPSESVCRHCLPLLPNNRAACAQCAAPMPIKPTAGGRCGQCLNKPPHFDHAVAAFHYEPPISNLIQDLKFNRTLRLANTFGTLLAEILRAEYAAGLPAPEYLIPVPLHPRRYRERGYNQAELLAHSLSQYLSIPVLNDHLTKIRDTSPQASLARAARHKNMTGAFQLMNPLPARHIALVDDVITTGSTANAAARELKRPHNEPNRHKKSVEAVSLYAISRA